MCFLLHLQIYFFLLITYFKCLLKAINSIFILFKLQLQQTYLLQYFSNLVRIASLKLFQNSHSCFIKLNALTVIMTSLTNISHSLIAQAKLIIDYNRVRFILKFFWNIIFELVQHILLDLFSKVKLILPVIFLVRKINQLIQILIIRLERGIFIFHNFFGLLIYLLAIIYPNFHFFQLNYFQEQNYTLKVNKIFKRVRKLCLCNLGWLNFKIPLILRFYFKAHYFFMHCIK